ncbi:hypothetical protein WMY93_003698 [Mugilogobius chulae]|uniref:Nuclear GTPase SLIP-GC n=1 Tax=Mugilogobius chulae TaxID=88201 RepID=A0AAW0Q786_9GOBI
MDDFVCETLTTWGLADLIERFKDEEVDKESLLCLGENDIKELIPKAGPRARFSKRLRELKNEFQTEENGQGEPEIRVTPSHQDEPEEMAAASASSAQDSPSSDTSSNEHATKRKLDLQPEAEKSAKKKRQCDTAPESPGGKILNKVKLIMKEVHDILSNQNTKYDNHQNTKLNAFLRNKIWDLWTEKRDLVGVFGKTGAGKSSLINAIIEEKSLLPTGSLMACTTAMIKVEANTKNNKYEAEIEFLSKEEWKDELWSLKNLFGETPDEEKKDDEEYIDNVVKMTAIYGDEWKNGSPENLMEPKYFKEIPEFLCSGRKLVQEEMAQELAAKVNKYTRNDKDGKRCFWPLVKCVTVRVPDNDLLKHVTLVDLPGNGDRNKSRDQMWKKVVTSCSTVWIVSEMNRAASDRDAWEILESTCKDMGNGGECQNICFICTKSDEGTDADSIVTRNLEGKDLVKKEFNKLPKVKKQFKDDCFEVFTVSSKEFFKQKKIQRDQTEIPKLQERLRSLNNQHDRTLNYVYGAYGILSLIQGAKHENLEPGQTAQLCENLTEIIECELQKVKKSMDDVYKVFEKYLSNGVEESKKMSEGILKKKLNPRGGGRSFHRPLKCALQNSGVHKTKKKQINLNEALSSSLTDSIDEEFRKTFPYLCISLNTKQLIQQYKQFELHLTFIQTEVAKVKTKLCKDIRDRKKIIYSSLSETVKETMEESYKKAATFSGPGSLDKMRRTVEMRLYDVKEKMFDDAKDKVLTELKDLMNDVYTQLKDTLQESIELSLKTDDHSIPDFERQFSKVKKYLDKLTGQNKEAWEEIGSETERTSALHFDEKSICQQTPKPNCNSASVVGPPLPRQPDYSVRFQIPEGVMQGRASPGSGGVCSNLDSKHLQTRSVSCMYPQMAKMGHMSLLSSSGACGAPKPGLAEISGHRANLSMSLSICNVHVLLWLILKSLLGPISSFLRSKDIPLTVCFPPVSSFTSILDKGQKVLCVKPGERGRLRTVTLVKFVDLCTLPLTSV